MNIKTILLFSLAAVVFCGCKKYDEDPEAPEIEFGGFNYYPKDANGKDVRVEMIVRFKDVNGDLGHTEAEKQNSCGYSYPDFFLFYEKYENGVFVPQMINPADPDTVYDANCNIAAIRDSFQSELTYSLTYIQPEGKNKSIEGEISYDMDLQGALMFFFQPKGRLRIYLIDRAGNKSNEIYSDDLLLSL
jgi:hypothetical protein